jgi:hypothetical protein
MAKYAIIAKIICTVPPSYENVLDSWESVLVIERTLTNLHARLLKEALRKVRGNNDDVSIIEKAYLLSK